MKIKKNKYYDGKISSGYEPSNLIYTPVGTSTPYTNMQDYANSLNQQMVPVALNGATRLGGSVYNLMTNWSSKGGMTAAGKFNALVGAAISGSDLANTMIDWNTNRIGLSDLQQSAGMHTDYIDGVPYNLYSGIDTAGWRNYVKQQGNQNTLSTAMSTANIGGSIGSIWGPWGMLAGTVLGGLGGFIWGSSKADKRNHEIDKTIQQELAYEQGTNTQNFNVAYSQALKNKFNAEHYLNVGNAKCGKTSGKSMKHKYAEGKPSYGIVETVNGPMFGPKNSKVSVGETVADLRSGKAHFIKGKTSEIGKDTKDGIFTDFDKYTIFGFKNNPLTGNTFAQDAAPYGMMLEKAGKMEQYAKGKTSGKTQKLMLLELNKVKQGPTQALRDLESIQDYVNTTEDMKQYKCGKCAKKYVDGKTWWQEGLGMLGGIAPYGLMAMAPLDQLAYYKGMPIQTLDSYAENANAAAAARLMAGRHFDIYNPLQALHNQQRQDIYRIRQSGYSPAQQMAMLSQSAIDYANAKSGIYAQASNENNKYRQEEAQLLSSMGEAAATRRQKANAERIQQEREAWARKRLGIETAQKGLNNVLNSYLSDMWKQKEHDLAERLVTAMENYYNAPNSDQKPKRTKAENYSKQLYPEAGYTTDNYGRKKYYGYNNLVPYVDLRTSGVFSYGDDDDFSYIKNLPLLRLNLNNKASNNVTTRRIIG